MWEISTSVSLELLFCFLCLLNLNNYQASRAIWKTGLFCYKACCFLSYNTVFYDLDSFDISTTHLIIKGIGSKNSETEENWGK